MEEAPVPPPPAPKARILVVEDEAIIANDIKLVLEAGGYRVTSVVATGARAVRRAEEDRPDLVLMDIVLPGELDGIQAARLIRARRDVPVVYLTAYTDQSIVARALDTEPFGYLAKPFGDRELWRTVEIALYKHRLERRLRESEKWLSTTLRSIGEAVLATGGDGLVRFLNPAAEELLGRGAAEALGKPLAEVMDLRDRASHERVTAQLAAAPGERFPRREWGSYLLQAGSGAETIVTVSSAPILDREGAPLGMVFACRDVTEQTRAEQELCRSQEELRLHVEEIRESNTALKVLLKQRESDRLEFEERMLENMRNLILPYVEKLRHSRGTPQDLSLLNIIEANLKEITLSFSRKLSSRLYGLSPQEIRIANLIKEGKQDKQIMEALGISFETVKTHRQNIRKKLGIYGNRESLSALLSRVSE